MSRFRTTYRVLNGPHAGDAIDAPGAMPLGTAAAVGWSGPKGMAYAVYVLTADGLMYVRSFPTPATAQAHVHDVNMVMAVAREVEARQGNGSHNVDGADNPVDNGGRLDVT